MSQEMTRRDLLKMTGSAAAAAALGKATQAEQGSVPAHLKGYEEAYAESPIQASRAWFEDAGFGLFMHYGLYSLLGRHEWVMFREQIPICEYEALRKQWTADRFDADFITDMALEAGMKYVNLTSRHHDSFCLFESKTSHYHSVNAPCGRDLVGELSDRCSEKGLGLFLYYSYGVDWWHPFFYTREFGHMARPDYKEAEPRYLYRKDEDFAVYIDFVHAQIRELLTGYGPLAGIWFDPIMPYYGRPDLYPIEETYALVRSLQPHILISFKQGANGEEDFAAPEREGHSLSDRVEKRFGAESAEVARKAWEKNKDKHNEICDTLQPHGWGYIEEDDGKHKTPDQVIDLLESAHSKGYNLLLNTGPLADGSIHPEDIDTLKEVGRRRKGA